jgi:hypothetical protein
MRPRAEPTGQRTFWRAIEPARDSRVRLRQAARTKPTAPNLTTEEAAATVDRILTDAAAALVSVIAATPSGDVREIAERWVRDVVERRVDVARAADPIRWDLEAAEAMRVADEVASLRAQTAGDRRADRAREREARKRLRLAHEGGYCLPKFCAHCKRDVLIGPKGIRRGAS